MRYGFTVFLRHINSLESISESKKQFMTQPDTIWNNNITVLFHSGPSSFYDVNAKTGHISRRTKW